MIFPNEGHPSAIGGFEVLERLGAGGAGQVYLARSKGGRLVAVKMLSPYGDDASSPTPEVSETLAREASLCVRLSHPAIVQVRALVEEEGISALVFDYVEGVALGRLLRFLSGRGERLADRAAWHIIERVLAALDYAHQQAPPIVHRDVSPSNVLLDWSGDAKLTDFGMAKMMGAASTTQLGLIKGTLGCMSPEQARGDEVTERADVYAAALLAWRLATGFAPFAKYRNDEVEMLRAMKNPRLAPLSALRPDLPAPLTAAVSAALEPDPAQRTLSAEEFRRAILETLSLEAGRAELALILEAARQDLARSTPVGGSMATTKSSPEGNLATSQDGGGSDNGRSIVTSRYSAAAITFDPVDMEEPVALRPIVVAQPERPAWAPESVAPTTGATQALPEPQASVALEAAEREERNEPTSPRRSIPGHRASSASVPMYREGSVSLASVAASQTSTSRLLTRGRRRRLDSRVVLSLVFVAFVFFAAGLALGLAMHR